MSEADTKIKPVEFNKLTSAAKEVLGQLFLSGPLWDGNVSSKAGRDELCHYGLVGRGDGWQWLTEEGVKWARSDDIGENWFKGRWRRKIRTID